MEVVIESNKRGQKLCYAGYMYTKTAVRKDKIWWKCSKRASLRCCASVSTSLDSKNPVPRILHNHGPVEDEIEHAKFRTSMRIGWDKNNNNNNTNNSNNFSIEDYLGSDDNNNGNDRSGSSTDALQQHQEMIPPHVDGAGGDGQKNNNNNNNNKPLRRNGAKFLQHRRRKKEHSQKNSARDLTDCRSQILSSILSAKGPMRQTPNNMTNLRLNHPTMKPLSVPYKKQQLSENGQNLFSHFKMNFASNTSVNSQSIKRPAPVSIAGEELGDIKPCKRELDAQELIQMEPSHSQLTKNHHGFPQVTSAQQNHLQLQTSRLNHHQATQGRPNHHQTNPSHPTHHQATPSHPTHHQATPSHPTHHQATPSHPTHHQATPSHPTHHQATPSHPTHHQATPSHPTHHQVTPSHPTHHQATTSHQNHHQVTPSHPTHHQATPSHPNHFQMINSVTQSQQGHSQITILSQNHHVTTGQHNYPKTNNTGHPSPFQVPTSKQSHQVTPGQKNHQNITLGHPNPHQVTTGQTMITDQQSQPQINRSLQKRQQLSPAQLRFLETSPIRQNRIEGAKGQQHCETLQESLKSVSEAAPDSHLKPSSTPDATFPTSGSKLSPVPQRNKKTFIVSKHDSTVMSSLASLWKDSKLCDATIGNSSFKIMVHKVVLLAISPKLLSQADIKANCFIRVNLPDDVSQAALVAFSEYMYHGVLTLDATLLRQLRIIAVQLGIRELELLCDTHLLYCDLQNSAVDSGLNLSETTCSSSLLMSTPEVSTPPHRISEAPEFTTVKQEEICEEFALNSSFEDLALPIKQEPVDHTRNSSASAQKILNSSISRNVSNNLPNANYKQQNLEEPVLGMPYNDTFQSGSADFEPSTIPLRQGAADCLSELNDILQIQKYFKKSDLPNFDCFDKSTLSLSPNACVSQSNDLVVHHEITGYNKNSLTATNSDNPMRPNCGDQSKKPPAIAASLRTSQPLEVSKESAELLTFQISDIRSVHQTIDLT